MIDYIKAKKKISGKTETRYGLSVVVDMSENVKTISCLQHISNEVPENIRQWFSWTTEQSCHLNAFKMQVSKCKF